MEPDDLTYSPLVAIRQPAAESSPELLRIARSRAPDPTIFDDFAPLFFPGEISSSRMDAYWTRMGQSTLKRFAQAADTGVAVLQGHDTRALPLGYSLTGRFVGGGGNGVARVESDFYVLPDDLTAPVVNRLRAGSIRDLSVGFYGGEWMCGICGRDMQQWMSRDGCPHFLGMMYTPRDEAGEAKGEPQRATATIENADLAEFSCVYDGATPGAMIQKARGMAAEGLLRGEERELVMVRYRLALPEAARVFPGADLKGDPGKAPGAGREQQSGSKHAAGERRSRMEGTIEAEGIRLTDGRLLTVPEVVAEAAAAGARALAVELRLAPDSEGAVKAAATEAARLRTLAAPVLALAPPEGEKEPDTWRVQEVGRLCVLADDGRTYREDLVTEALAEGVRALGNAFAKETYEPLLRAAPLATVKRMRDDWRTAGDEVFKGGRKTTDGGTAEPPAAPAPAAKPAWAFS